MRTKKYKSIDQLQLRLNCLSFLVGLLALLFDRGVDVAVVNVAVFGVVFDDVIVGGSVLDVVVSGVAVVVDVVVDVIDVVSRVAVVPETVLLKNHLIKLLSDPKATLRKDPSLVHI